MRQDTVLGLNLPRLCDGDVYYSPPACRALAAALLLQAVKDARRGDMAAWAWVLGSAALTWAEALGVAWPPQIGARRGAAGQRA